MNGRRQTRFGLDRVEWLLIGVAAVLFLTGAILLVLSPRWWGCYLDVLDVRYWPPWKCLVVAVLLLESLLLIRFWPDKER